MVDLNPTLRAATQRILRSRRDSQFVAARSLAALAACAAFAPAAFAQAPAVPSNEQTLRTVKAQEQEEEVAIATQIGKTPQLLRDVPQTITVLNREVLDAQGATTLGEALRNVPGITLSAGEGGTIGDNVNLRGFSARTDIYIDGIRDRGQYSRETFFLDAVEVLKGPSSMLFGRGSTGGVINQVSKQPNRRESSTVGAAVGTDHYYRVTTDTNRPLSDNSALRLAAFAHKADSTRDVVKTERYGFAPSFRFGIGSPTDVTLSAIIQRRDDIPDYGFPFAAGGTEENPARPLDISREKFLGFTDDRFRQDVDVVTARISHEFSPNFTLRNQTQFNQADIYARPTTINNSGLRNPRQREIEDQSLFNQTDLVIKFGSEALAHTFTTGVELGRDSFENQTYTTTVPSGTMPNPFVVTDFNNPVYGPTPAIATVAANTFTDNTAKTLAVYANEQLDIGSQWKVIAGVRWDRFEFDSSVTTNATGFVDVKPTKTDKMTSVRGGVVYQPDEIQTYYVSYGTSFNPSAEALTISTANQSLDPEENRSLELGGKLSFDEGALFITGAAFRVEKTNARTTDALLGTSLDGDIRVQGVEFGISGNVTDAWTLLAGYTYLDGEIVESRESGVTGNVYPNTPEHNASLWSTYDLPFGLQLGGGLIYATDRLLNNANTAMADGYTRVDATLAYIQPRYTVRLNVQNVTDAEYFEVASAGRATITASRAAIASFSWTF